MNKPAPYCTITPTYDSGYNIEINRYYVMFRVFYKNNYWIAYCSCTDYNEVNDEIKSLAIEFMTFTDLNTIDMPYDKKLFDELTEAARDMFTDLVFERKSVVG